jgi:hypothetical protein
MKDRRRFTITRQQNNHNSITTGLTLRQLRAEIRNITEGEVFSVEVRTPENDPMHWGP